jgi:hypothetical protein
MARTGQSMPSAVTDEMYVADVEAAKWPPDAAGLVSTLSRDCIIASIAA